MASIYRNISFAAAGSFRDILTSGVSVSPRGDETKEVLNRVTAIERPLERFLFLPGRMNDFVAQIAESIWVLAGKDDIVWLKEYLKRAPEYSDDGQIWRAAYGPRLRRWHDKVDQIDEVRKLLIADPSSRRAVMGLYDPELDFVDSLDIPCNNLLAWLVRDGRLHLTVFLRSNDAMWGFSGANAFEWSVLHELMAGWLGVPVGPATFIAGSFHLYGDYWDRANRVSARFRGITPYDFGVPSLTLAVSWDHLGDELDRWFEIEASIRNDPFSEIPGLQSIQEGFLKTSLDLIRLYWIDKSSDARSTDRLFAEGLAKLPECDAVAAAYEFFGRTRHGLLRDIPHPAIAAFFEEFAREPTSGDDFLSSIKIMHAKKDRAYGGAWKKRGELISVLPNIARKVDRLSVFSSSKSELSGETVLDTAVDLLVYSVKYQLFLEDILPGGILPVSARASFADHEANFDIVLDGWIAAATCEPRDRDLLIGEIEAAFERLWPIAQSQGPITERKALSAALARLSYELVATLRKTDPESVASFIETAFRQERHGNP